MFDLTLPARTPLPQPPFLPTTRAEMDAIGWDSLDILLVTGDAYVDHPSFGVPLLVLGRITSRNRMMFAGEGCIVLPDGTVAVTAKAKYMRLPLERISDFEGDSYVRYPSPEDPAEIDVPDNW